MKRNLKSLPTSKHRFHQDLRQFQDTSSFQASQNIWTWWASTTPAMVVWLASEIQETLKNRSKMQSNSLIYVLPLCWAEIETLREESIRQQGQTIWLLLLWLLLMLWPQESILISKKNPWGLMEKAKRSIWEISGHLENKSKNWQVDSLNLKFIRKLTLRSHMEQQDGMS